MSIDSYLYSLPSHIIWRWVFGIGVAFWAVLALLVWAIGSTL